MAYETLLYEKRNAIGHVTINRPEKLNALNCRGIGELFDCFQALQRDDEVRVVILTGSGEKAFVAGADVNELALQSPVEGKETSQFGQQVFNLIENLGKPVIAAINGFALVGDANWPWRAPCALPRKLPAWGNRKLNLDLSRVMAVRSGCLAWWERAARWS